MIDEAGRPLSNMSVDLYYLFTVRMSATSTSGYGQKPQHVTTDAEGRFEVSGRPPQCSVEILVSDATGMRKCSAYVPCDPAASDPRLVELKPLTLVATGNVSGAVTVDGRPLAGARVSINLSTSGGVSDRPLGDAKTDENGRFEVRNIEAGHRLYAVYQSENSAYRTIAGNNGRAIGSLAPGQTIELDPFEFFTRTQTVSGIVVDPAGKPLPDVAVQTMSPNIGEIPAADQSKALTDMSYPAIRTGADGRFSFEHLFDRPVRLCAMVKPPSADPNAFRVIRAYVTVAAGETNAKIVLDPLNNSPDGIQLQPGAERSKQPESRDSQSEPDHSNSPAPTELAKQAPPEWLANPDRKITGRVVLDGTEQPVINAQVDVPLDPFRLSQVSTRTDASGRFTVQLPPNYLLGSDSFDLTVTPEKAPGFHKTQTTVEFAQGEQRKDILVRLSHGERIAGSVVDDASGAGIAGVGVTYVLEGENESMSTYWDQGRQAWTDQDGRFELKAPPNQVTVRIFQPTKAHHRSHDVPNGFRWEHHQSIRADHSARVTFESEAAPRDIRLAASRGMIIRGRAADEAGKPIPGAIVEVKYAIFDEGGGSFNFDTQSEPYKVIADQDGRFELSGLPPDCEAFVRIHDPEDQRAFIKVVEADHRATGERIVPLEQVVLSPKAHLRGQLLCDNKPVADVKVFASMRFSGKAFNSRNPGIVATDSDGYFDFERLDSNFPLTLSYWTTKYGQVSDQGIAPNITRVEPLQPGEFRQLPAVLLTLKKSFVAGTAVDPAGHPLADVEIQTLPPNMGVPAKAYREPEKSRFFGSPRRQLQNEPISPTIRTGADGKFRFEELLEGPVDLIARVMPSAGRDAIYGGTARMKANANEENVRFEIDFGPPKGGP